MTPELAAELVDLGRAAARAVAGPDAVREVEVEEAVDSVGRPTYRFTYLVDRPSAQLGPGLLRTRITQRLLDVLSERGEDVWPILQMLDRADWDRRNGA